MSIVYGIVGLIAIGCCLSNYEQYKTEKAELLTLLENPQYQSIEKQYEDIASVKNKILKNSSGKNKNLFFKILSFYMSLI